MTYSIEDSYTPEGRVAFDAFELADQIVRTFRTILASDPTASVVYLTVGPERLHVGRVSQIVETLSDGSEARSIHLDLVDPDARS